MAWILVVGGGFAGVVLATHLARRLPRVEAAEVLLVDQKPAHAWKPRLHTFAAGASAWANEAIGFVAQAARSGFRFRPGALAGLDRARRVVRLGPVRLPDGSDMLAGREVAYDTLVLAVGSRGRAAPAGGHPRRTCGGGKDGRCRRRRRWPGSRRYSRRAAWRRERGEAGRCTRSRSATWAAWCRRATTRHPGR